MGLMRSRIKSVFDDKLLRRISAVCDTRKIQSNKQKMYVIWGLLKDSEVEFAPLGSGTNRIAVMIDSYVYKFALDNQGYQDNWVEYSLSEELQPHVTLTYETNGYIAVAQCVKSISTEEYTSRKTEMSKILDIIGSNYLLGDVGLVKKNYKNWGVDDDGKLRILDYAYIHRATETFFTCDRCGAGILSYDPAFTKLVCRGACGCGASFTYEQKRRIGITDEDINNTIQEAKHNSLVMTQAVIETEVMDNGKIIEPGTIVIRNETQYKKYLEEVNYMCKRNEESLENLVELANAKKTGNDALAREIAKEMEEGQDQPKTIFEVDGDYLDELPCESVTEPKVVAPRIKVDDEDVETIPLEKLLKVAKGEETIRNVEKRIEEENEVEEDELPKSIFDVADDFVDEAEYDEEANMDPLERLLNMARKKDQPVVEEEQSDEDIDKLIADLNKQYHN